MFCSGAESSSISAEMCGSTEQLSHTPTTGTYSTTTTTTTTSDGTTFSSESTSDGANVF